MVYFFNFRSRVSFRYSVLIPFHFQEFLVWPHPLPTISPNTCLVCLDHPPLRFPSILINSYCPLFYLFFHLWVTFGFFFFLFSPLKFPHPFAFWKKKFVSKSAHRKKKVYLIYLFLCLLLLMFSFLTCCFVLFLFFFYTYPGTKHTKVIYIIFTHTFT